MGWGQKKVDAKHSVDGIAPGGPVLEQAGEAGNAPAQEEQLTASQKRTLYHLQTLSRILDSAIGVPGTNFRLGLDAMIGLIPLAGDMMGAVVGTYIISRALKYNLPKRLVFRMLINQGIDSVFGMVPLFGDIFDVAFKANSKNMILLQEHLERPKQAKKADTCFLLTLFVLVVILPLLLVAGVVVAIVLGVLAATGKL